AAFFQISDGIQVVLIGILRGLSDVRIPALTVILAYWVIGLPLGFVLAFHFGLGAHGIWYGLLIGLSVISTGLIARLIHKLKKLRHQLERQSSNEVVKA
ncbi:MAG: MATE family efflux transporter, partial [Cytophagales bacterium]